MKSLLCMLCSGQHGRPVAGAAGAGGQGQRRAGVPAGCGRDHRDSAGQRARRKVPGDGSFGISGAARDARRHHSVRRHGRAGLFLLWRKHAYGWNDFFSRSLSLYLSFSFFLRCAFARMARRTLRAPLLMLPFMRAPASLVWTRWHIWLTTTRTVFLRHAEACCAPG